tara:strand:- start:68 stop:988 length:921 start_codon:yes stop_codon:yes gene_type:complete
LEKLFNHMVDINTLLLCISKIKNFGRKKIFRTIFNLNKIENMSINEIFIELELESKISENEFILNYEKSVLELENINDKNVDVLNIFENDIYGFYKNQFFLNNKLEISEFPNQLFLINKSKLNLNNFKNIFTVIGTRNNSIISKDITEKIVDYLVKNQSIIVSGLAKGIDTIAHKKVIDLNGRTIAVLGNGLDTIYPAENRELAKSILKNGILLSEYSFGIKAEGFRLVERDRIQAMLANDIVLIESSIDGGSMHAIKWAKKLNKRIWCFNMNVSGNKDLIENYEHTIVFSNIEEFIKKFNLVIKK